MGGEDELYGGAKRRVKRVSSVAKPAAKRVAKPAAKRVAAKAKPAGVKRRRVFHKKLLTKFGGFLDELYVDGEKQGTGVGKLVQQLTQQFQNNVESRSGMAGGKLRRKKPSAAAAASASAVKKPKRYRKRTHGGEGDGEGEGKDASTNDAGEAGKGTDAEAGAEEDGEKIGGGYRKVKRVVRKARASSPTRKARPARKARPVRRRSASPGRR